MHSHPADDVRVFMGPHAGALGLCGILTFRNEEWTEVVTSLDHARVNGGLVIDVLPEDPDRLSHDANYLGKVLAELEP